MRWWLALALIGCVPGAQSKVAATAEVANWSMTSLPMTAIDGTPFPAESLDGKVVLFVNVASRCGLTPQYEQLEALYQKYSAQGLVIVGSPSNQFLGQEPGSPEEIVTFCKMNYGVTFPLLDKQAVNGRDRSQLYKWLVFSEVGGGKDISWNFEKFIVSREGQVIHRFSPRTTPDDPAVVAALEAALASAAEGHGAR